MVLDSTLKSWAFHLEPMGEVEILDFHSQNPKLSDGNSGFPGGNPMFSAWGLKSALKQKKLVDKYFETYTTTLLAVLDALRRLETCMR